MSDEPSLRDILDERTKQLNQLIAERTSQSDQYRENAKDALNIAREVLEKWQAGSNEWRLAMSDKDRLLARVEDLNHVAKSVQDLLDWKNTMAGVAQQKDVTRVLVFSIIGALIGVIGMFTGLIGLGISIFILLR